MKDCPNFVLVHDLAQESRSAASSERAGGKFNAFLSRMLSGIVSLMRSSSDWGPDDAGHLFNVLRRRSNVPADERHRAHFSVCAR